MIYEEEAAAEETEGEEGEGEEGEGTGESEQADKNGGEESAEGS
jgi:hypothetical protein